MTLKVAPIELQKGDLLPNLLLAKVNKTGELHYFYTLKSVEMIAHVHFLILENLNKQIKITHSKTIVIAKTTPEEAFEFQNKWNPKYPQLECWADEEGVLIQRLRATSIELKYGIITSKN